MAKTPNIPKYAYGKQAIQDTSGYKVLKCTRLYWNIVGEGVQGGSGTTKGYWGYWSVLRVMGSYRGF